MAVRKIDWDSMQKTITNAETRKPAWEDENKDIFQVKLNKTGKFNALTRFMPPHVDDDLPYVKVLSHSFKIDGKWLIETCPKTIGKKCPVCELYWSKYNKNLERQPDDVAQFKSKINYWYNIYVIRNEDFPDTEGTVKKLRTGVKIHGKLMAKVKPEDPNDTPINIFDYENGASFKFNVRLVSGNNNYDTCDFSERSYISHKDGTKLTEAQIEELDTKLFKLSEIISPDKFKSYEELAAKLEKIVGGSSEPSPKKSKVEYAEEKDSTPPAKPKVTVPAPESKAAEAVDEAEANDEDDDDFFAKLTKK